jgi:hypothetical protein
MSVLKRGKPITRLFKDQSHWKNNLSRPGRDRSAGSGYIGNVAEETDIFVRVFCFAFFSIIG